MWAWLSKAKQFFNTLVNRVVSKPALTSVSNLNISVAIGKADIVTEGLINGTVTVGQWQAAIRDLIKQTVIQQYATGAGGIKQLTSRDFGSIGGIIADQCRYLDGFAAEIAAGELTPGQILTRVRMYINSAREAYNRAKARAFGLTWNKLPQYPGDGRTACLCITTPDKLVYTIDGYKPMIEIDIGDYVLTHKGRFRRVYGLVVKDGGSENEYTINGVGCTGNHLWYSPSGWINSNDVYNDKLPLFVYIGRDQPKQEKPEISFNRILPPGTKVYDIMVEDDHSFVIEGLVSHNTNCACSWEFDDVEENGEIVAVDAFWVLGAAEHCPDCLDNAAKWNPLRVEINPQ